MVPGQYGSTVLEFVPEMTLQAVLLEFSKRVERAAPDNTASGAGQRRSPDAGVRHKTAGERIAEPCPGREPGCFRGAKTGGGHGCVAYHGQNAHIGGRPAPKSGQRPAADENDPGKSHQ